jgi:hypothetical protein
MWMPIIIWDIFLVTTVAVGVLATLEVLLSDSQKQWSADRTLYVWHWLAEAKQNSLLDWLRQHYRLIA